MDDNDFDQTQAIFLDDYNQETDEDTDKANTPVAYLKVSCQSGFPEETFPLVEGDNVIGRHKESCKVCIPLKALSREHACIEIRGDSHLIYDKNSRNKTKRNKLYLNPDVRYELQNGDTLMFGDVTSKYSIVHKDNDVGSETGSESEYQTACSNLDTISKKDETFEMDEMEYDSDNSVDLLQPTQAYTNNSTRNTTGKLLLADVSIDERDINKTTILVEETPAPPRQKVESEAFVEESGSETEDEADVGKDVPQTLVVEESQEDESGNEHMLYAQTQAYTGEDDGDLTNEEESKTIFTEATQAFPDVLHQQEKSDVPTQTFVEESDTEDEEAKKSVFQYAATQAYLDDVEDVDNEPRQTTEEEGEAVDETDEEDVSHLFAESTLACDIDDFTDEGGRQVVDQGVETQMVLDEPTQAVIGDNEDAPTQVVPGDEPTRACPVVYDVRKTVGRKQNPVTFEDATVAVVEDSKVAVVEDATVAVVEDATVAVVEDATFAVVEDATVAVVEDATVAVEEDATVAVVEDATVAVVEDPTVTVVEGATVAVVEDATVAVVEDTTLTVEEDATGAVVEDPTMAVVEDATVAVVEDPTVAVVEDATVAIQEDATVAVQEDATVAVQEDATVAVQEDATIAVQEGATVAVQKDATVAVQEDDTMAVQEDSTLIAITSPERSKGKGGIKNSATHKSTTKLQDEVATKGKGKVSVKKKLEKDPGNTEVTGSQESEEGSIRKSSRSKRKSLRMVEMEESLDDLAGIDRSIKSGQDYSPDSSETESPRKSTKTETRGRKPKVSAKSKSSKEAEVVVLPKDVPPFPKEVVKQTETQFLMTLPALQNKDLQIEATQVYAMDTDEELPNGEILQATQPYVMNEDDSTPPLEEETKDEGDVTPPIEDVLAATQAYGVEEETVNDSEEAKYPLIAIPSRSPLKPTLVSPEKRKKSPSPKRVQFTVKKIDSTSTDASEKGVETDGSKTSTSKVSKSTIKSTPAVSRVTRGKQTAVVESKKLHVDDNERTNKSVRGKKSVTVESAPVPLEKQETKTSRGRRSVATKTEKQVPETSEITTKTRGRKSIASKKETQKVVEVMENKINKADEEGGITLISDREKDNENDKVVETPTRKGRSRTSMSGQSNMQIGNSDKNKEVNEAETSKKSTILRQKKNIKNTCDGDSDKGDIEQSKSSPERTVDHSAEENVSEKAGGCKSRHVSRRVGGKLDTDNSDTLNTTGSKTMSGVKSESRTDVEDVTENDTIETSKSDTKQRGRRGRSSILSVNEKVETADEDIKSTSQTGRRGRSAIVDSERKDDSKTEGREISESETKPKLSGRRGRPSALERNSSNDSSKSESDETGNKTVKRGGQRSSSQSPSKTAEESKPTERSRRGRSVIQVATADDDKDSMPPPRNIGRRGKKDSDIIHDDADSNTQDNKRNSRQLKATVTAHDSKKGGTNNKKDKSFNLDVSLEDNSEKDKSDSSPIDGKERLSSRNRNKELVKEETDTKPVRGKRKRESLVDQSINLPSTSKQSKTENTIDNNVIIKRGRFSDVTNKAEIKVDVMETKKEKIQTKKRGRTDDEDSPDTPGKKTKLNELQTQQPKKTLAVGSPTLRRKSMEPTKPKVLFTGVVDEHGQKVIKDLGGEVVNNVNDCTHLVTDKVRRTVKFLCCLARGIPIITLQWIESCRQSAMFVDGSKFQVKDTTTEKQYKFSLQRSLEKAKEACLFQGYKIHVTKNVKPEPAQMKEIIECAGGRFLSTMPKKSEDKLVIVSCPEDKLLCSHASMTGVPVVNPEFILTGILRQEISVISYALFTDKTDNPGKASSHRKRR